MDKKETVELLTALMPSWHCKIERTFKQLQKNHKISFETYYCLLILNQGKALTMSELSHQLRISKQRATRMITALMEHDFVRREYDQVDRRIVHIQITPAAQAFLKTMDQDEFGFAQMLEKNLSTAEIKELGDALHVVLRMLEKLD